MSYPIIIPPPEPEPRWVWISARRAAEIRSGGKWLGVSLLAATLSVGAMITVLALQLLDRSSSRVLAGAMGIVGLGSVACLLFSTVGVWAGVMYYVQGEHLNVVGAQITRRLLGGMWGFSIFLTLPMLFVFVSAATRLPLPLGILALVLAVAPVTIAGIAFFKGRKLFGDPLMQGRTGR